MTRQADDDAPPLKQKTRTVEVAARAPWPGIAARDQGFSSLHVFSQCRSRSPERVPGGVVSIPRLLAARVACRHRLAALSGGILLRPPIRLVPALKLGLHLPGGTRKQFAQSCPRRRGQTQCRRVHTPTQWAYVARPWRNHTGPGL